MKIAWLFSENTDLGPQVDVKELHDLAPIWGGWKTWRGYGTDNVICYDVAQAHTLIDQDYQKVCNLYIHQTAWEQANKPSGVRVFGGEFPIGVDHPDDIVAMHLAASQNQIVLMLGFGLDSKKQVTSYVELIAQSVKTNSKTQWVLVDHAKELASPFADLKNITCDTLKNVLQLLKK
jgi:hypothetical protein